MRRGRRASPLQEVIIHSSEAEDAGAALRAAAMTYVAAAITAVMRLLSDRGSSARTATTDAPPAAAAGCGTLRLRMSTGGRWSGPRPQAPADPARPIRRASEMSRTASSPTQRVGIVPLPGGIARGMGPGTPGASTSSLPTHETQDRISGVTPPVERTEQRSGENIRPLDSVQYLGRLADKMFTMGRIDAAVNILAHPISDLLAAARSGHVPEAPEVDAVGRYAMKLASETLDPRWVDAAIELHHLACRAFRADTAEQFAILRSKAPLGSSSLLQRYQERLRGNMSGMNAEERALSERVGRLV